MKSYSLNNTDKDKILNQYNNEYGFNLNNEKEDVIKNYLKPHNIVNSLKESGKRFETSNRKWRQSSSNCS